MSGPDLRQDAEARHQTLQALRPDDPEAVRKLIDFLGDSSWRVRKAALVAVPRFRDRPSLVVGLVAGLAAETNVGLRNACAEALLAIGGPAVDVLAAALRTTNPLQRKFVAEVLGRIATRSARDVLVAALDDPDENVRASVAESLGGIGGTDVINRLRGRLKEADGALLSAYLLDALSRAGARLPFTDLEPWAGKKHLLRHVHPLLGRCADARAVEPLFAAIVSSSRGTRYTAITALAQLHFDLAESDVESLAARLRRDPVVLENLREAMSAEADDVARAAVELLGLVGDPSLAPAIIAACANRSFLATGIEVVHGMGRPAVEALAAVLYELDPESRVVALEVVEMLGDESTVGVCLEAIENADPRSAEAAIRALGRFAGPGVAPILMSIVRSGHPDLTEQSCLSLAAIGRRNRDAVARLLRSAFETGEVLPGWLFVLGAIGRSEDVATVAAAIAHSDAAVRAAALGAIAEYGSVSGIEAAIYALADEHALVRAAAARALATAERSDRVVPLLGALHDPDPWVVAEAARALGWTDDARALPALLAAAGSTSSPIAIAALGSLFRLNPPELAQAVHRAVCHADPEVVQEGIRCTMRLADAKARALLLELLEHRAWDVRWSAAQALINRDLTVPADLLGQRLDAEDEPLVKRSLEQLRHDPEVQS